MGNLSCVSQENVSPIDREDISKVRRQSSKVHPASDGVRGPTPWQETSTSSHRSRKESNLSLISFRSRRSVRLFRRQSTHRGSMKLVSSSSSSSQSRSVLMKIDGQLLQKYTVHNIIGAGAFSNVIAVEDKTTATKYALKIIEKKRSFRTNVPWERELDILKRVHHPNIVHLYETHSTTSKVYFILELALGGDLGQRLSSMGHFEESKAKELLAPILDALRYLHKHGVTHRDVKLENCLFKTDKEDSPLLLSDFGLAHLRPDDKKDEGMQTTCGTADYISPEMLEGEIYTDLVDMWSFGVIVYAVLSGKMPFMELTKSRMFKRIREGRYDFDDEVWSDVSDVAKDFIRQLICVDINTRLTAKDALKHSWVSEPIHL